MKIIRSGKRQMLRFLTIAGCLLLFFTSFGLAESLSSAVSVDETFIIQGIVRRVFPEKNMILVKIRKGGKIKIRVNQQTAFVDITFIKELEKGQGVKVWYTVSGEENNAIKVEKLQELGC